MGDVTNLLQAFWRGMAIHLWQTTLVLLAIVVLARLMRRAPARLVHLLWWVALAKLFLPLSLLEPLGAAAWERLGRPWSAEVGAGAVRVVEYVRVVLDPTSWTGGQSPGGVEAIAGLYAILTLTWLGGMGLLLARWIGRATPLHERYPDTPATVEQRVGDKIAMAIAGTGIPARYLRVGATRDLPAVVGLLRPRILIPRPLVEALDVEELRAVLLHEESHRRRRDPARAAVQRFALLLFFFYPPAWWLVRRLRDSAEAACDEAVLGRGVSPATYGRALTRSLGLNLEQQGLPAAVGLGRASGLRARLERIENSWRCRIMPRHRWLLATAVLLVIGPGLVGVMSANGSSSGRADVVATITNPEAGDRFSELDRLVGENIPVQLNFEDVSLEQVFLAIERVSGVRVEVEGELPYCESIDLSTMPLREALVHIALKYALVYDLLDRKTLRVRRPKLAGLDGVTNPVLVRESKVLPGYPEEARKAGASGQVILQAVIRRDGTVTSIEPLKEVNGFPSLTQSAIDAVSQWRYEPARLGEEPVDVFFTLVVQFALDESKHHDVTR